MVYRGLANMDFIVADGGHIVLPIDPNPRRHGSYLASALHDARAPISLPELEVRTALGAWTEEVTVESFARKPFVFTHLKLDEAATVTEVGEHRFDPQSTPRPRRRWLDPHDRPSART